MVDAVPTSARERSHPPAPDTGETPRHGYREENPLMNLALIIIIVVAVVLAIFGGLNSALSWLLWVALIVGVIALIVFLFRVISGGRNRV